MKMWFRGARGRSTRVCSDSGWHTASTVEAKHFKSLWSVAPSLPQLHQPFNRPQTQDFLTPHRLHLHSSAVSSTPCLFSASFLLPVSLCLSALTAMHKQDSSHLVCFILKSHLCSFLQSLIMFEAELYHLFVRNVWTSRHTFLWFINILFYFFIKIVAL